MFLYPSSDSCFSISPSWSCSDCSFVFILEGLPQCWLTKSRTFQTKAYLYHNQLKPLEFPHREFHFIYLSVRKTHINQDFCKCANVSPLANFPRQYFGVMFWNQWIISIQLMSLEPNRLWQWGLLCVLLMEVNTYANMYFVFFICNQHRSTCRDLFYHFSIDQLQKSHNKYTFIQCCETLKHESLQGRWILFIGTICYSRVVFLMSYKRSQWPKQPDPILKDADAAKIKINGGRCKVSLVAVTVSCF